MAVMGAPSKWLIPANPKAPRLLYSVPLTSGRPLLTHTSPLLETPGLSWASLGQPLVGSLLLFPGSWCAQGFVCALQVSVSPVLCKSCNQIPLVFKVKFPRGSQCFCQIPPGWGIFVGPRTFATVWELLWYNCSPVWGSSAWWLYSGANGELLQEDLCHTPCSHVCQSPCPLSPWQAAADLCSHRDSRTLKGRSHSVFCGVSGLWCTQGFVWALQASLVGMGFDSKCSFTPPTVLLGLLPCPWMIGIFFQWDPTFLRWLFSSDLQFWSSRRRIWTHVLWLCHLEIKFRFQVKPNSFFPPLIPLLMSFFSRLIN